MTRASPARLPLLFASAALLSACTVGPDYRVPNEALANSSGANRPFTSANEPALSPGDVPEKWWRLYEDPTLDQFIQAALQSNTDLRAAAASLSRSAALLAETRTLRQPSIPIDAGVQYGQTAGEQYLLRVRPPRSTDYEVQVAVGYDLDLFGAIRRGIEAAEADYEAVQAARDIVRVNVVAETARAYANVCSAGLEIESAKRTLALLEESLALTERLQRTGRATQLDVTRASQLVEQFRSNVPPLEAAQRNGLYRLATLTGRAPADFDVALETCNVPPRLRSPLPTGDGMSLLKRRPDVRRAERQLAAATANIGVATAQLYPDVQLGLSFGSLGLKSDFLKAPTDFWNIGGLVRWQANQSAARARVDAARAGATLALAAFDGVVLESLREVETSLNSYVHDLQREAFLRAARDEAARATADAQRMQLAGRATALAVVDAQRTLATAEQALAQIQSFIANDQVSVFLALGGGWQEE